MMWKFKTSKYKNAHPKIPKKEEWITNIAAANFLPSCGNHIQASAAYIAYNSDIGGGGRGCLGLLPLSARGRQVSNGVTLIHAHAEHVTDFAFSPFDDFCLATCSQDGALKTWELPDSIEGIEYVTEPSASMHVGEHKVECLRWHPSASGILAAAAGPTVKIYDVGRASRICDLTDHEDTTQALDWHGDGSLLVTGNKDRNLRIFDPRSSSLVQSIKGHEGLREMRVLWLGNTDYILSTGFDASRNREVIIRDVRKFDQKLCVQQIDTSTGTLIPFYDTERFMLFLCGKGDTVIQYFEFSGSSSTLTHNSGDNVSQMKGAAMAPRRAVDVMAAEVNHMLLLIKNAIVPLPICCPRKSYTEFHRDLFPDIPSAYPAMTAEEWLAGENRLMTTVTQDPTKRPDVMRRKGAATQSAGSSDAADKKPDVPPEQPQVAEPPKVLEQPKDSEDKSDVLIEPTAEVNKTRQMFEQKPAESKPERPTSKPVPTSEALQLQQVETILKPTPVGPDVTPAKVDVGDVNEAVEEKTEGQKECGDSVDSLLTAQPSQPESILTPQPVSQPTPQPTPKPQPDVVMRQKRGTKVFSAGRQSKFRHLRGTPTHKSEHIENLKNVDQRLPGESNMFHGNATFCAVPLSGPGGSLAVLKLSEPGRLPDSGVPVIENGYALTDFCFDPFDDHILVTACDDGKVRVWQIPEGGLKETMTEPKLVLKGHGDKVNLVQFHPLAKDVLLSAAYDLTVRVWDVSTGEEAIQLSGHTDSLLCAAWSPDGRYIVTVCRDGRLRLYSPRQSTEPLQEGPGPDSTRGARAVWTCNGHYLVISGMDKMSNRVLMIYDPAGLAPGPLHTFTLGVEAAILIPYYDADSNSLFLTGRGDGVVVAYEVAEEPPYFFPLSNFNAGNIHQALSFLPKRDVHVKDVEFAKALRLTTNKVETVSFTVPRVKMEYFQDDLYPDTQVTWEPTMTSEEWFSGVNRLPEKISLKPKGMDLLSSAPVEEKKAKYESFDSYQKNYKTDEEKKEELLSAMTAKLDVKDEPLPQDLTEGVDEDEWDDY